MAFLSQNLNHILDFGKDLDAEIDLADLTCRVAEAFGKYAPLATALLGNVTGKMKLGTLGVHLQQILKHDSAVRDVLTTGHLAKFLSRLDIFERTNDYRIVAMFNPIFDVQSQLERAKYFERGNSLDMDGDLLDSPDARLLMSREEKILRDFFSHT